MNKIHQHLDWIDFFITLSSLIASAKEKESKRECL